MRLFLFVILVLQSVFVNAQTTFLTSEERAYFFHIVRKNHVIDNIIGRYLEYSGDTIYLNTGEIDYDSLEQIIILEPTKLKVDYQGIKLSPQSILAEAASKMAIWKFMNILEDPTANSHTKDYESFMKMLRNNLPDAAYASPARKHILKNVEKTIDPYMPFVQKRELLYEIKEMPLQSMIDILKSIDDSYKDYVYKLTLHYFDLIGGKLKNFSNTLLAAGEGSSTNGMMEEFEKDEQGKVKKNRPKGIGLYNYQYTAGTSQLRSNDLKVKSDPIIEFMGYNDAQNTSLHMSLWGFNAFFQTTVVVKSGNLSYVFYASRDTKQLSPDSTYYHGVTYRQHITDLEENTIPKLRNQLYGEEGYVNSKEKYRERMEYNQEKIRKAELELRAYQTPHNKKYKKAQQKYIGYSNAYFTAKNRYMNIANIIYNKERQLEYYEDQLYYMKSNLGSYLAEYELRDSIYYFEDGSTFNPYTQDFHFNKITDGYFTVRLISIGSKPLSVSVDEVQLLVNVIQKPEPFQIYLDMSLTDLFNPDGYEPPSIPDSDSLQNRLDSLINYIVRTDQRGLTALYAGGIGTKREDGSMMSDTNALELPAYPGVTASDKQKSRQSAEFKDLRRTNLSLYIDGTFNIHIVSYTDPVMSNLRDSDSLIYNLMMERWITGGNEMLSALRSFAMLESFINKVQYRLTERKDLSIDQISKVNENLLATKEKSAVRIGKKWLYYADYKALQSSSGKKDE